MGGGRHSSLSSNNSRSITILFIISITLLFCIFSIFSTPSSPSSSSTFIIPNTQHSSVEYSFVSSLQKFLTTKPPNPIQPRKDKGMNDDDDATVKKLDNSIWKSETEMIYNQDSFFPISLPVKVYVYDMPSKFTYDLLWLFHNSYRDTSNLTSNGSPVHRLIEQHSIDYWLWADLIAPESERPLKKLVVRVDRQEVADLFYIPFFTTISFFLLEKQQCKALYRVKR